MSATIAKWGNSLAIRIPQAIAQQIQFSEGREVELSVIEGKLMIQLRPQRYSLEELVSASPQKTCTVNCSNPSKQGWL